MMNKEKQISAVILAGGQGRRFNYQDKGLVLWNGEPLIAHVVNRLQPQVDQIIINCNRNTETYKAFGYPVCHDRLSDFQGPLAGLQAALNEVEHTLVLVSPCDTPRLPNTLVKQLLTTMEANNADLAYPHCEHQSHYIPALMKSALLPSLNNYLLGDDRSIKGWYRHLNHVAVPFPSQHSAFSNFNRPEDM